VEIAGARVEEQLRGKQGRQLFAFLVVNRNRAVSRDELIDAVWPFEPPANAGAALSTLLSHLRRALGADAIQGRGELQLMLPADAWIDVEAAAEAVGRAEAALAREDWSAAWSPAQVALSIAERGFLPGHDAPWIDVRRRDVEELLLETLECVATLGVHLGGSELTAAERAARRLIDRAPTRESGHVALMEIQEVRGNAAEGLRIYEDLRQQLRDELGTAPGAVAQEVHMRLLEASDAAGPAPAPRPSSGSIPSLTPLPALLDAPQRAAFVGRGRDMRRLELALERTDDIPTQLALVAGEPGIGKTRLVTQFGRLAYERGARVLYGRTDEDGLVPYGPFVEALRHLVGHASPALVERAARLGGGELRGLIPALGDPAATASGGDPALARYRLFDAISALLVDSAREQPLVLLLDDLHWADEPTLLLLKHVLRAGEQQHLLVVATYRDAELHRARALADALGDLQRDVQIERVHLRGLAQDDVAALARDSTGSEPPAELVKSIHGETEGNPFFVLELARHIADAGGDSLAGPPEGVREVILRRLAGLGEPAQQALRVAAALGREFDLAVLERFGELDGDTLVEAIEEALEARVLMEVPGRPERFSFAHALTRTTLYGELTAARRIRAHERIGRTLIELVAEGRDVAMAEIASHLLAALPRGDADEAIDYACGAAREANELLAYEEAADHLERAVAALDRHRPRDVRGRVLLLLELGHAQRRAGRMPEARETFLPAIEAARSLADSELLAEAVLGYGGGYFESAYMDEFMVALLEEALAGLDTSDSVLRVELLSRLAKALYYSEDDRDEERRRQLSEEAVGMAEGLGDTRALLVALEGRHFALTRPENLTERIATARRIIALGDECGDRERNLLGRYFLIADLVEADELEAASREMHEYGRLAREARLPLHLWYHARFRAMQAILAGRLDEGEATAQEAFALGSGVEPRTATMHFGAQMWVISRLREDLAPLEEAVRGFVEAYPRVAAWRVGLGILLAMSGRIDEAREVYREFTETRFRNIPRDAIWSSTCALATELVMMLGDADDARALYELIRPYAHRNTVTGEAIVCTGPMSLYSGVMALYMGDVDAAVAELEDALTRCERDDALLFGAQAAQVLAGAHRARGDEERARETDRRGAALLARGGEPTGELAA
jgi:DNA-binding SARP family transcriptional activator/tetratricopeptide (TPR) repeat protein